MASQFVITTFNNVKDGTNLLSDLINIILEYLRYQQKVTLSEKDLEPTFDKCINNEDLFSFESGPLYSCRERDIPDYPVICLQVISRTLYEDEKYYGYTTLEMLVAQPLLYFDDNEWIFGSDRCFVDKELPQIRDNHYKECSKGDPCRCYNKRKKISNELLHKDRFDKSNLRYEVRLIKYEDHIAYSYLGLPYPSKRKGIEYTFIKEYIKD